MHRRVRAAASLFFFSAAQARNLSLSGTLGWAEGALTSHPRNSDGGAAIEFFCVLGLSLGSLTVWAIDLVERLGLRPPCYFLRRHRRRALCYGLLAWAWLVPWSLFVELHNLFPQL